MTIILSKKDVKNIYRYRKIILSMYDRLWYIKKDIC